MENTSQGRTYMFFELSFWQGFVGNLLATIIGVAIGIPVAFWVNRRLEANTEKEKKKKILDILSSELNQTVVDIISLEYSLGENENIVPLAFTMSDEVWRALSDGGELQWIKDPELLLQLASVYAKIKYLKILSQQFMDAAIYKNDVDKGLRVAIAEILRQNIKELKEEILQANGLILKNNDSFMKSMYKGRRVE